MSSSTDEMDRERHVSTMHTLSLKERELPPSAMTETERATPTTSTTLEELCKWMSVALSVKWVSLVGCVSFESSPASKLCAQPRVGEDFVRFVHGCFAFLAPDFVWVRSLGCLSTKEKDKCETRGNMVGNGGETN